MKFSHTFKNVRSRTIIRIWRPKLIALIDQCRNIPIRFVAKSVTILPPRYSTTYSSAHSIVHFWHGNRFGISASFVCGFRACVHAFCNCSQTQIHTHTHSQFLSENSNPDIRAHAQTQLSHALVQCVFGVRRCSRIIMIIIIVGVLRSVGVVGEHDPHRETVRLDMIRLPVAARLL